MDSFFENDQQLNNNWRVVQEFENEENWEDTLDPELWINQCMEIDKYLFINDEIGDEQ